MSLTSDRVSINTVIAKVYRDLGLKEEYDLVDLVEWAVEALAFIGAYQQYEIKETCLTICNHRAELPCDLVALIEVMHNGKGLDKAYANNFNTTQWGNKFTKPYSYNLNQMDSLPLRLGQVYNINKNDSFKYEKGWIKTSFEEGELDIKYSAIETDEDGLPLIPDEVSYKEAIATFIRMKFFYKKSIVEDRFRWFYQDAEQKWQWYCGQAGAKAMSPDIFTLENIKRNFLSYVPNLRAYVDGFSTLNENK